MKLGFQPNEDTEQIIKLRLQLAKNKSKVVKYDQLTTQITQLHQLTSKLIERLNLNHTVIYDLVKTLGINQLPYLTKKQNISFEGKQSLSQLVSKYTQLLNNSQEQNQILKLVVLKITKMGLENEQIKENQQQLQRKYAKFEHILLQSQQLSEKVKQLTIENTSQQQQIKEMQRVNQELKKEYSLLQLKLQCNELKVKDLQNQIQEKNIQIERLMGHVHEEEYLSLEKAKIIEKCNKLITSVQLADDEYITHYFRSNGLPLDVQKPLKNKYQLVFE